MWWIIDIITGMPEKFNCAAKWFRQMLRFCVLISICLIIHLSSSSGFSKCKWSYTDVTTSAEFLVMGTREWVGDTTGWMDSNTRSCSVPSGNVTVLFCFVFFFLFVHFVFLWAIKLLICVWYIFFYCFHY